MEPTIDEIWQSLEEQGYRWHEGFNHGSIFSFVRRYFFQRNPVVLSFWIAQSASFFWTVWFWFYSGQSVHFFLSFLAGMACFAILIPFHELLHGIGYRLAGAQHVNYRVNWRQFVFYAIADRFVTRKLHFVLLALTPFVVINSLLVLLIVLLPSAWVSCLCGVLFMHIAGCSGDFALMSYFYIHWSRDPVTFDDAVRGESHFFLLEERQG